jgi:hypothetical protein
MLNLPIYIHKPNLCSECKPYSPYITAQQVILERMSSTQKAHIKYRGHKPHQADKDRKENVKANEIDHEEGI